MQVHFKEFLHGCRLDFPDCLMPLRLLFLDALLPLGVGGSEDGAAFGVDLAPIMTLVSETALVSSQTLTFCFPLIANFFSSLNAT